MSRKFARQHAWSNRLQTVLLMALLLVISGLTGSLILGELGFWTALFGAGFALLFEPVAAWRLTLRLYRARPIYPDQAPLLWQMVSGLAQRAGLPAPPVLYYLPSAVINAFAVGNRKHSAIALTDGLLSRLTQRELAGVLGHEISHIANGDLKVMGLADYISRLTNLFSGVGQILILLSLPLLLTEGYSVNINPLAILLLVFSPHLALLTQLGLSRVREFDADLKSASLTGDPMGLASALAKIERAQRSWLSVLLPGWGNPEPSWLRSHPATEARIERLTRYAQAQRAEIWPHETGIPLELMGRHCTTPPRWRIGGLWH